MKCNLKIIDYSDITLSHTRCTYSPFTKPNNEINYNSFVLFLNEWMKEIRRISMINGIFQILGRGQWTLLFNSSVTRVKV